MENEKQKIDQAADAEQNPPPGGQTPQEGQIPPEGSAHQGEQTPPEGSAPQGGQTPPADPKAPAGDGRARKKKRALLFLVVLAILLVVFVLLNSLDFEALAERFRKDPEENSVQSAEIYSEWQFNLPDYDEDVTADAEYMDLVRDLTYTYDNESFGVTDNPEAHGPLCVFWFTYMNALIAGDSDTLNALHADDFVGRIGEKGEFTDGYRKGFAPQKVFNFRVTLRDKRDLQESGDADGNYRGYIVYYFDVSYQIKDNNGTFRRDITNDERYAVPLRFEVLERGNEIFINDYSRIRSGQSVKNEEEGINIMMYIWIGLILLAIVAELMTTALTAVWFIPAGVVSLILSIILPDQIVIQIVTYVAVSALFLVLTRPLVRRHLQKGNYQPTNADMAVGKTAIVTERIDNIAQTGEVKLDGKRWSARSSDGSVIEPNTLVNVLEIQGVKLICKPAPGSGSII